MITIFTIYCIYNRPVPDISFICIFFPQKQHYQGQTTRSYNATSFTDDDSKAIHHNMHNTDSEHASVGFTKEVIHNHRDAHNNTYHKVQNYKTKNNHYVKKQQQRKKPEGQKNLHQQKERWRPATSSGSHQTRPPWKKGGRDGKEKVSKHFACLMKMGKQCLSHHIPCLPLNILSKQSKNA